MTSKHRQCVYSWCDENAYFVEIGKNVWHCKSHRLPGMIGLLVNPSPLRSLYDKDRPDLPPKKYKESNAEYKQIDRQCIRDGCILNAHFGYIGCPPLHCYVHKLDDMTNLNHYKCKKEYCEKMAIYGHIGKEKKFCVDHKEEGMVGVTLNICSYAGCDRRVKFSNGSEPPRCKHHRDSVYESPSSIRRKALDNDIN